MGKLRRDIPERNTCKLIKTGGSIRESNDYDCANIMGAVDTMQSGPLGPVREERSGRELIVE